MIKTHEFQHSPYWACERKDDKPTAQGHGFVVRAHDRLRPRRIHEFEGAEIEGKLATLSVEGTIDGALEDMAGRNVSSVTNRVRDDPFRYRWLSSTPSATAGSLVVPCPR